MTRYRFNRHEGLVDDMGNCILKLVGVGCTESFRVKAGKELANKLNTIEQSKECMQTRAARYKAPDIGTLIRVDTIQDQVKP